VFVADHMDTVVDVEERRKVVVLVVELKKHLGC
jgi:hypothetical protein